MKASEIAKWERIEEGGKWRFVLLHRVLGLGLSSAVVVLLIDLMVGPRSTEALAFELPMLFGGMLLGGIVGGLAT